MNDCRLARVQVLETSGNVEHQVELLAKLEDKARCATVNHGAFRVTHNVIKQITILTQLAYEHAGYLNVVLWDAYPAL